MTMILEEREGLPRPGRGLAAAVGLILLVAAGAAVGLRGAGDRLGDGGDSATASATTVASGANDEGAAPEAAGDAGGEAPAVLTPPLGGVPVGGPRIVKTGDLRVEVAPGGFAGATEESARVAEANGGFVESSTSSSFEEGRAEGDITIRVPSANFEPARRGLAGVGELRSETVGGEDVTAQLVDLAARLRTLRAEEDVLNELLGRAANIGEVLQVRDRIAAVRLQIEQLAAQESSLDGAASLATLRVSLFEPAAAVASTSDPDSLGARFDQAVEGAVAVLGGMMVVTGWLVPFVALAALGWAVLRLWSRRRLPATSGPASA